MSSALWIAIAATVLVILAHVGLFWWFLCRRVEKPHNEKQEDEHDAS